MLAPQSPGFCVAWFQQEQLTHAKLLLEVSAEGGGLDIVERRCVLCSESFNFPGAPHQPAANPCLAYFTGSNGDKL